MTKSYENDNDDDDFKHVCIIIVFLLIRFLYLFIHSLDYLFRFIQILVILTDLIDLVVVPSLIACCLLNLPLKLTSSQHKNVQFIKLNCQQRIKIHMTFLNNLSIKIFKKIIKKLKNLNK